MIYCVIPPELADGLYEQLSDYYRDNPNVTVIVDRRGRTDRVTPAEERRRPRLPGTFLPTDPPDAS